MRNPIQNLLGLFIYLGCAFYIYGIALACIKSWPPGAVDFDFKVFLATTVTSIAALLATNLGAVLGITITNPNSSFHKTKTWNPLSAITNPEPNKYQVIAIYVYVASLLACTIVWGKKGFTEETTHIIPIIPEMTKTLIGVIIGSLALGLNIKTGNEVSGNLKS